MLKIAIILVHNKSDKENFNQIETVKPFIEKVTFLIDVLDEQGNVIGQEEHYYYKVKDLNIDHEIKFYQIIPFGVTSPANLYDIDSHKVFYGKGDEDKIGDHPRFFNWGLKRGTDYGADVVIYLEDYSKFSIADLPFYLTSLIDPEDKTEFIDSVSCKISTLKLLKEVGQLNESKNIDQAIIELKTRIESKGMKNG